jgi:hypothetical protein
MINCRLGSPGPPLQTEPSSRFPQDSLDHADGDPIDLGDLGDRQPVIHPGSDARVVRPLDQKLRNGGLSSKRLTCQGGGKMALILTAEDVVRRIAAECAYIDHRGGVGIWLGCGDRAAVWGAIPPSTAASASASVAETAAPPLSGRWSVSSFVHLPSATPNPLERLA